MIVMENKIDDDKRLYTLAVLKYKSEHPELKDYNMFSSEWNLNKDYKTKINILAYAIQNHITVEETLDYQEKFIEKVK